MPHSIIRLCRGTGESYMIRDTFAKVKNILVHILVLSVVFVGAVIGFARWINQTMPSTAQAMENSSFPLVYMQNNGVNYNCLHGYAYEMDVNHIRDTVTVLKDDHELDIQIQPFSTNIESLSYEVLTLDGAQSLENTNVVRLEEENGFLNATFQIQNHMLLEQEYILKIQVTAGGRNIFYYTRLLLEDGLHLEAYLDFVTGFYQKCVNKTDETSLASAVEPGETTDKNKTLAEMDLHDSVQKLMWGSLNPQMYYKPTPSLVDINGTTASFVLDYRISAMGSDGVMDIYNVKEFYRLRYTDTRVFLLDFTRTTDEIFNTDGQIFDDSGILLGITSQDVEYAFDAQKKLVAFVQEDELWTYRVNGGKLTRIFGFPQRSNMDYRDFYDKNTIQVLRVETNGDVWFTVAGYMNRGKHEGENGIGVYHYEEAAATVEEILFVQTMEAYDMLHLDMNALSYITDDQEDFYVLVEGIVYRINLATGEYERTVEGICSDCYASSASNRYFAWLKEGKRYDSQTLCIMDFETGTIREVTCEDTERIRPLGFMGEDIVYGKALTADIDCTSEGSELFPMYVLSIVNEEGEEVKTYQPSDAYVMDVEKSDNMLKLLRATKEGSVYTETTEDHIISTDTEEDVVYGVTTEKSDVTVGLGDNPQVQSVVVLRLGATIRDKNAQVVTAKLLVQEGSRTIRIPSNNEKEKLYYVYAGGRMESCWPSAAEAIRRADEKVGVVINDEKEFVWERGNKAVSSTIRLDKIPDAVKSGTMDVEALEQALGKDVIELTGCTLDQVLYFVSKGRPVLAETADGTVIIAGYDDFGNTILLRPGDTETSFCGPNDSKELFEAAGNHFVTYLETDIQQR